jgi:hypothetical protein
MKKFMKSMITFVSVLALTILLSGVSSEQVCAAQPTFWNDSYTFMYSPEWDSFGLVVMNLDKNAKVTVSSANKKIATVEWDKENSTAWVHAKRVGTVKITVKVKQGGKTYKKITRMKWTKYSNPIKTIKIGTKKYPARYFDKNTSASMKKISGSKKVTVKLKKGYKINSLGFSRGGVYKDIKNGAKIRFTRKGNNNTVLFIHYTDPKGNFGTLRLFADTKNYTHGG